MYALVDKNVKKKCQDGCIHDQYAEVNKTVNKMNQKKDDVINKFVVADETAYKSVHVYHELKNVTNEYAVVDKSAIKKKCTF